MIPILGMRYAIAGNDNGLARLNDTISCIVTEERNGKYVLEMTYPITGEHFNLLQPGMSIYCKTSEAADVKLQTFFIEGINPTMSKRCKVTANHCSYELNWAVLAPKVYQGTMDDILLGMYDDYMGIDYFPVYLRSEGYGSTQRTFSVKKVQYVRSVLGGTEGSLLDVFGGEWEWDNNIAILHNARGADMGAVIRYGKNLTDANPKWSVSGYYDAVVAYWEKDGTTVISDVQGRTAGGDGSTRRVYKLDLTEDYENAPTKAALNARALAYANENGQRVGFTASVKFQPLWQTEEYKDIAALERVALCDIVTVKHPDLGLDVKTKVTKTVYDVLKERYTSISLGTIEKSFADIVAEMG